MDDLADYVAPVESRRSPGTQSYASSVYVVVCRGPNCRARGALHLRKRLVELVRGEPRVHLLGYSCFGLCDYGPNVAFYPECAWYGGLCAPGDAERVIAHAMTGEPLNAAPIEPPAAEREEHLRNIGELIRTRERDRARPRRWWWPF
jgi:(2Fe-2S) ferredoxin